MIFLHHDMSHVYIHTHVFSVHASCPWPSSVHVVLLFLCVSLNMFCCLISTMPYSCYILFICRLCIWSYHFFKTFFFLMSYTGSRTHVWLKATNITMVPTRIRFLTACCLCSTDGQKMVSAWLGDGWGKRTDTSSRLFMKEYDSLSHFRCCFCWIYSV